MVKQHVEVTDRILLDLNVKTQIHVLHVDDDAGFLKVSKQILELEEDLTVGTASSVEEAFEKMKHNVYDAIVSDLEMPGKNGLDFLEKLRASGSSVPFVLFTGKGREEIAVKAFNLGADGYFNKSGCPETVFGELAYGIRNSVKIKHAEQSSKDSENKYRVLLMSMLNGFAYCKTVFDEKGKPVDFVFLEVNRAFEKMVGLKRENIIGKNVTTVIPGVEKVNPELFDSYDRVAKTGKEDKFEVFFKPLNMWLSISTYSPNKGYFVAIFDDTTEHRSTETEMRKSELILQNISDSIIVTDLQGQVTSWNKGASLIFGFSAEEMLGEPIAKICKPKEREQVVPAQLEQVRKGDVVSQQWEGVRKDGLPVWLLLTTTLLKNTQNETVGMIGVGKDITERKKTEETLKKTEEKLRSIFAASPDPITVSDLNGNIVECNQAAVTLHGGQSKEELIGKNSLELIAKKDRQRAIENLKETLMHGSVKNLEYACLTKNGREFPAELTATVVRDASGKPEYFIATTTDITERKKTEEALHQSEVRYRELTESIGDVFFAMDKDFRYTYWNKASEKLTGISAKDAIGKCLTEVFPDVKGTKMEQVYLKTLRTQQPQSYLNKYQLEGKDYVFEINAYPTKTGLSIFAKDITERRKAEELVRASEERYRSFIEVTGQLGWTTNANGEVEEDIPAWRKFTGRSYEEVKGWEWTKALHPDDLECATQAWTEAVATKSPYKVEYRIRRYDGVYRHFLAHGVPVFDEDGSVHEWVGTCIDITEHRKAEKALEEREEKFRAIFEGANDGILAADVETKRFAFANPRICEITGYSLEELLKLGVGDIHPKKDLPYVIDSFTKQIQGKLTLSEDIPVLRKDEEVVYCDVNARPTKIGSREYLVGFFRDATERKNAENKVKESEEKHRSLFELAPDGIIAVNMEGITTSVNRSFLTLVGYDSEEEIVGKPFTELITMRREDIPRFQGMFMSLIKGESPSPSEFLYVRKDGTSRWAEVHPGLLTKDGNPVGLQAIIRDATERKNAEKLVQESQQKFRGLFNQNPEAAVYLDLNLKVLDANPRFCQLFGYSKEETKNRKLNDLIVPENLVDEAERLDKDAQNGYASHDSFRKRKDGSLVSVSISATPLTVEDKIVGYIGIYKDITKLAEAYEEVEEARKHFQTLFDLMADPVCIIGEKGIVLDVTQKLEEVFGFKKEELVGKHFGQTGILSLKSKEIAAKNFSKRMMGYDMQPYTLEMLTKKGKALLVEINARVIQYKGERATLNVLRDVSERKKLEEKLRVVGSLTRHDVRNKLSAVTGNAYLLKRKLAADPEALGQIGDMEAAVGEVEKIFEFARVYEKLGVEQLTDMDVAVAFDEAAALFSRMKGVRMVNECQGVTVLADSLLRQLFYNLIDDSLKYGEKVGQIRVHCRESSEGKLEIVYEDDGVGVPETVRSNLFKEGYGKGTGYGLFLIRRICEVYGWTIRETGKQGQGAQFTMTTPPPVRTKRELPSQVQSSQQHENAETNMQNPKHTPQTTEQPKTRQPNP
jgi:PAS domain S-box-containing protein